MGKWEKQINVIPLAWGKASIFPPHNAISPNPPHNLPKKVCSVVTCILFVFSALIETVVTLLLNKISGSDKNKLTPTSNVHVKKVLALDGSRAVNNETKPSEVPKCQKFYLLTGAFDTIFLIIFLSLFSLFNAVYWSDLLST